jgi:transcriptional regulator with XRE-family HTH domain
MATGKEIKRLRESNEKKISVAKAASLIGIDSERLRKWEQRDADPNDSDDIEKVEKYFGVSLDDLKKLDNFQFKIIKLHGKLELNDDGETEYQKAGKIIDYVNGLKDQIQGLKEDKIYFKTLADKRLEIIESNSKIALENQQKLKTELAVAFRLIVQQLVGVENIDKLEEVSNEFDTLLTLSLRQ